MIQGETTRAGLLAWSRWRGGQRLGVVVLTSRRGGGFGWKEMSEDMGPYESDCPASILDMLSPVDVVGGYAGEWRERCRANLASRRERSARRSG